MGANEGGRRFEHGRQYVDRIREDTQKYAHDLLAENERLRLLVGSLEDERVLLEERNGSRGSSEKQTLRDGSRRSSAKTPPQRAAAGAAQRAAAITRAVPAARGWRHRGAARFSHQFLQIERQNSGLEPLRRGYQLHGTLDRDGCWLIQEISPTWARSRPGFELADGGRG
jgi:hypothetical protein